MLHLIVCLIVPAAWADDLLKFRNRDILHGSVTGATATSLRWQSPAASEPIQFAAGNLAELHLAPRPPKTSRQLHPFLVELTNGDQLTGDITALDEQSLTLHTWYSGKLSLPRAMIKRLSARATTPGIIYTGPTGLAEWRLNQPGWTFQRGKLYSTRGRYATIGKNVELPDVASIEFDIAWRGQASWIVSFYGTDASGVGGAYQLYYSSNYLRLRRSTPGSQRDLGGSTQVPQLNSRSQTRVTIRVNKPQKTIAVSFDNELIKQWTDPDDFAGKGGALIFQSQGQGDLSIANILVAEWDGKLETSSTAPTAPATEELLHLANGDKVSGALLSITGAEATVTNSFAALKIALPKISSIEFRTAQAAVARRQETDVRAFFPDGAQLTVALQQLDDKGLAGTTENCGRVVLPLDTFTRLRFHLYDKSIDLEPDDNWPTLPDDGTGVRRILFR